MQHVPFCELKQSLHATALRAHASLIHTTCACPNLTTTGESKKDGKLLSFRVGRVGRRRPPAALQSCRANEQHAATQAAEPAGRISWGLQSFFFFRDEITGQYSQFGKQIHSSWACQCKCMHALEHGDDKIRYDTG